MTRQRSPERPNILSEQRSPPSPVTRLQDATSESARTMSVQETQYVPSNDTAREVHAKYGNCSTLAASESGAFVLCRLDHLSMMFALQRSHPAPKRPCRAIGDLAQKRLSYRRRILKLPKGPLLITSQRSQRASCGVSSSSASPNISELKLSLVRFFKTMNLSPPHIRP